MKHSDKLCSSFMFLTGPYWVKIHIKPIRVKQTDEKYSMKQNGILYYSSIKFILPYFPFLSFLYFAIFLFASFLSPPLFSTSSDLILCRFPFTTRSYFLKFVIFVLSFINEFISVNENTTNRSTKSFLIFLIISMIRNSNYLL
jgi:hypothetical protein